MPRVIDYSIYLVTDHHYLQGRDFLTCVEQALAGGVTLLQLREKTTTPEEFEQLARQVKKLADSYNVPLIINDNVELARAVGAAGVHIGQDDWALERARTVLGPEAVIGVSAHTVEEALKAQCGGADYLGVGAVFPTGSKADADVLGLDSLRAICAAVQLPVVGIGGITLANYARVRQQGAVGCAMIAGILGAADIKQRVQDIKKGDGKE